MHPVVKEGDHDKECVDLMNALMECHKNRPITQMLNGCLEPKAALDKCLDKEYERRYEQNQKEAAQVYPAFRNLMKMKEEKEKQSRENRKLTAEEKAKLLEREGNKL
ncbi:hypothetical protein C9374_003014 [Naegleria lovaniensis]|uniref:COX assembly mitochondrial protein n=1 Tax=Naegleria lovaniensis TaxID=51637 RepID=A0AA88GNB2_NAELO|nr:uncharacterized protein C9374_003014 [Naegleria lovaniensis]KAG2385865.1 hypothetical protein C9374_003014 [Naegleria lovaniensis]